MDKELFKIFALNISGLGVEEDLEDYICKKANLPKGYFTNKYKEISEKANRENTAKTDLGYRQNLYLNYMSLYDELKLFERKGE